MSSDINDSTPLNYCINKAIPDGSNLYYATLFEDSNSKNIIIGLHAFLYELTEIIRQCTDPGVARIKLKWWQEEIERLFNNQPRHPITRQLQKCITLNQDLKTTLEKIINNFDKFVFISQPNSLEEILSLYSTTSGELWYQCGLQLSLPKNNSLEDIKEMGGIYHFINSLQQANTYINEARCIIPTSVINQTELLNFHTKHSKFNQAEVFQPLLSELKEKLELQFRLLTQQEIKQFQYGLIMNRLIFKTCDEIIRDGSKLLDTNINLTPIRKLWIAWRTHISLK